MSFTNPYVWLGILLAILAIGGSAWLAKASYDNARRDEGRNEIRQLWHQAVVAQQKREADAAAEADRFQRSADAKRDADFKRLAQRTVEAESRLAAHSISGDLAVSLSNATRAANGESTGESAKAAAASPAIPADELTVAKWYDKVAEAYSICRDRVAGWVKWDDDRLKGATQ